MGNETKAAAAQDRVLSVWDGRVDLHVKVAGSGPAVVYLHSAGGLHWSPFLDRLAEHHTVYAPEVPGTSAGDSAAIGEVDDLWDLVLIYEEMVRTLGLERPVAVGASFGGMLGCEVAAAFPTLLGRLVVIDPIGLWLDEAPVVNWLMAAPESLPAVLFHDPTGDAAKAVLMPPEDPDEAAATIARTVWSTGCTAKFIWPIPDKGLAKRLHRIAVPSLVIWGKQDGLVPVAYAAEFGRRIARSRVEIIDACGHAPEIEQLEQTFALVSEFLSGS
jgi:pimeloyl-ACP methyl ester carboxylesterase